MADLLTALGTVENYEIKVGKNGPYVRIKVDGLSFNLFDPTQKKIAEENVGKAVQVNYEPNPQYPKNPNAKAIFPQNATPKDAPTIEAPPPAPKKEAPTNKPPMNNGEPIKPNPDIMHKDDWELKDRRIRRTAFWNSWIRAGNPINEKAFLKMLEVESYIEESNLAKLAKQLGFVDPEAEVEAMRTYCNEKDIDPKSVASVMGFKDKEEMKQTILEAPSASQLIKKIYEKLSVKK